MNAILEKAPSLELDAHAEPLLSLLADALDDDVAAVRTSVAVVTVRLATVAPVGRRSGRSTGSCPNGWSGTG